MIIISWKSATLYPTLFKGPRWSEIISSPGPFRQKPCDGNVVRLRMKIAGGLWDLLRRGGLWKAKFCVTGTWAGEPSNEIRFGGGKLAAASCRHGAMFQGSHNTFSVHESDRSERSFIYCSLRYKLRFHDLDVILWAQSSHNLPLFLIGSHVPGQFVLGCTEAPPGLSLVIFMPPPVIFTLPTCLCIRRNDIKPQGEWDESYEMRRCESMRCGHETRWEEVTGWVRSDALSVGKPFMGWNAKWD